MFGERLKILREEKGLKQSELASILGIGRTTLSNYELNSREPDLKTLIAIAEYFGVTVDYLLGRTEIRTLDDYKLINDIRHLEKDIKEINPEVRKGIDRIINTLFLIINQHLHDKSPYSITQFGNILEDLRELDSYLNETITKENLINDTINERELSKVCSEHRRQIDYLIENLVELYYESFDAEV